MTSLSVALEQHVITGYPRVHTFRLPIFLLFLWLTDDVREVSPASLGLNSLDFGSFNEHDP